MIYIIEHNNRPISDDELKSWLWDCLFTEQLSLQEIGLIEEDDLDEAKIEQYISQISSDKIVTILKNISYLKENQQPGKNNETLRS
ncbi:hypothetical protein [Laspinema olomoucense]|uniref:hypothetical protein n=1 Tax=Laspinema olomoucense TaxID=3231600 RepID=UPI0021BB4D13|nr:hypothetical protein [Laspinema sp. D3d]MCT7971265.1 hypothetical protein [Laspinema sp. D3d]